MVTRDFRGGLRSPIKYIKMEKSNLILFSNLNTNINICDFIQRVLGVTFEPFTDNVWFSSGALDIIARLTVDSSTVNIKANTTFFKHQTKQSDYAPFITYIPTTGISNFQFFCLSSKNERKKAKESVAKFLAFFEKNYANIEIFPKNLQFMVSPYIQRYSGGGISAIFLHFETDDNTWNFYEQSHPVKLLSPAIYYSSDPLLKKETLREFFLRKINL